MTEVLFILTTVFVIYTTVWSIKSKEKSSESHSDEKPTENQDNEKPSESHSNEKSIIRTHYDNLKVARDAPTSVIKAAYKALCQTYHPDKFQGSNEEAERVMKLINASYAVLIDPVRRAIHDVWIREQASKADDKNQQSDSTETEAGSKHNQKQDTKREDTSPPPQSKHSKDSASVYSWRRYFARMIDINIASILIILAFALWQGTDHHQLQKQLFDMLVNPGTTPMVKVWFWGLFSCLLWVVVEPIVLSNFGTTPGKALFRLRLVSDNTPPNYMGRSLAVWAVGMGFSLPIISTLAALIAGARLKTKGKADWDRWTGFSIEGKPLSISRIIVLTVLMILLFAGHISALQSTGLIANGNIHPAQQVQAVQNSQQSTPLNTPYKEKVYFDMSKPMVIEYPKESSARLVQVAVSMLVEDEETIAVLRQNEEWVRNDLMMVISVQSPDTLSTREGKDALRKAMLNDVRGVLKKMAGKSQIEEIFFTSFVMQ